MEGTVAWAATGLENRGGVSWGFDSSTFLCMECESHGAQGGC